MHRHIRTSITFPVCMAVPEAIRQLVVTPRLALTLSLAIVYIVRQLL
jgi:hypothetical protein